jgi:hypothetical protein
LSPLSETEIIEARREQAYAERKLKIKKARWPNSQYLDAIKK